MNDDGRQRGILARRSSGARPRSGSVPQPNVLSDASTPNRLSSDSARAAGALRGTQANATQATAPRPASPTASSGPLVVPSAGATPRSRSGLPSLSTLIFLGFLALTGFRIFGEFVEGNTTPTPGSTSALPPSGPVTFGTGTTEDCDVMGAGVEFDERTGVWWSATLSTMQPPAAAVIVIILRDGIQISREDVPADDTLGAWDVLCSSEPIAQDSSGRYRVEVWNGLKTRVLAAGEYVLS